MGNFLHECRLYGPPLKKKKYVYVGNEALIFVGDVGAIFSNKTGGKNPTNLE